jgi:hypothetical protein
MNIWEQQNSASVRVLQLDGTPLTHNAEIGFGPVDRIGANSFLQFDSSGYAKRELDHSGLWRMDVIYRDSALTTIPIHEPYYQASGEVATSANLDGAGFPELTARRVEAGSARIRVLDINGEPLHVTVQIMNGFSQNGFSGTTDEHGEVVFSGLTTGEKYFVHLSSTPETHVQMIDLGKFLVHPTTAEASTGEAASSKYPGEPPSSRIWDTRPEPAIMEQIFVARSNTESRILMRAVPLTYVYGMLHPPDGGSMGTWGVWLDYPPQRRGAHMFFETGAYDFIAGPFPPGDVRLNFGMSSQHVYHAHVSIREDEKGPIRFDIDGSKYLNDVTDSPDPIAKAPPATVVMGMGGISSLAGGANQLTGRVFLADGVTPALGAQVLYFPAHRSLPTLFAMADAQGFLQPRGLWRTTSAESADHANEGPVSAEIVAFLPGACGAVVEKFSSEPGKPIHIVLPRPTSVTGRVTVGGGSPVNRPGNIHVMAAVQGRSFLNPYLSVETSADADGNFTLAGLAPGDYVVQASLDRIWLSSPVLLHIARGASRPVSLDIPRPGAAVRLELRDHTGKPVAAASATLDRPGPLAVLWPDEWVADGVGSIYIPTLEAGWQTVRVPGAAHPLRFKVPPLPSRPLVVSVVVENQGKKKAESFGEDNPYSP